MLDWSLGNNLIQCVRSLAPRQGGCGREFHRVAVSSLDWVNFQVMRRTHSSLSRRLGVDPKTVADQLGHGIGVNLDVYTQSGLEAQRLAVTQLEEQIFSLSGVQRSTDLKWVS
jgi:hypothetical protein